MTEREEKAKAWLNRNYGMSLKLEAIGRRLERMESDLEKVCKPIRLKEVQENEGAGNGQEERMAEYIDLSAQLERELMILLAKDKETLRVISMIEGETLQAILIERYVNRLKWDKVLAHLPPMDKSTLFRYHLQALSAILPYIPEEAKG